MLIDMVNTLFDEIKRREGLKSDAALARHLGVTEMAILRWRRGEYPHGLKVIGPQLVTYAETIRPPAA